MLLEKHARADPEELLRRIAHEADGWGGAFEQDGNRGSLQLPVLAGLRRGSLRGKVHVEAEGDGSRLTFEVEESVYRLQTTLVTVLALAAAGALVFLVGPFFPPLRPAVPLGFMLSLGAWFVIAGLRNSGPEEFFEVIVDQDGS
jgi:hypothetical protein